jgi:hypothetical protein
MDKVQKYASNETIISYTNTNCFSHSLQQVVVLAAMVASSLAIPAYDRSSYGHSTSGGVIYAQRLANTRGPTLGYSRASNPGYSHAASTNLGYTHGSARYGYDAADNYVSNRNIL